MAEPVHTRVADGLSAFAVLSLIGFPAIIVFAIGVMFLLWVARLILVVWIGLALALRWTWYNVIRF